jgi:hypothetical protein
MAIPEMTAPDVRASEPVLFRKLSDIDRLAGNEHVRILISPPHIGSHR